MMADAMYAVYAPATSRVDWSNATHRAAQESWIDWTTSGLVGSTKLFPLWFPQKLKGPDNAGTDPTPWSGIGFMLANRHFGNPNVLYVDGHVKFRRRDDIYDKGIGNPNSEWANGN